MTPASADVRATTDQRIYLLRILARKRYISADHGPTCTSRRWLPLFRAATIQPPEPGHWPSVATLMASLTVIQASAIINHLIDEDA